MRRRWLRRQIVAVAVAIALVGPLSGAYAAVPPRVTLGLYDVDADRAAALRRVVRNGLAQVQGQLDTDLSGAITVEFVGSDAAWDSRLDAHGVKGVFAEPWIAGLAILHKDVVLVRLHGPGLLFSSEVTVHELAHLTLHALTREQHLPRWFHEGVAMYVAGEATLSRLNQGPGDFGRLSSLSKLNSGFSGHRMQVQRAYTTSAGFVRYAVTQSRTPKALGQLLRRMHAGLDFHSAFVATFGLPPDALFERYASVMESSPLRMNMYLSETILWGLIGLLSLLAMGRAWWRRPRYDGEPLDLEAIAAAGVSAHGAAQLWLHDGVLVNSPPMADETDDSTTDSEDYDLRGDVVH